MHGRSGSCAAAAGRLLRLPAHGSLLTLLVLVAQPALAQDVSRWEQRARNVTITRDDWGIPHIVGKTDADAVFGMIYAQAEDDFNRIETNYLNAMGRLAEAEGEAEIFRDLRMKLFIDPDSIRAIYQRTPDWLKQLMNAWADGLNYFLHQNPQVKPRVLTRFEPWMALTFSEGSIGGDIEQVSIDSLRTFYGRPEEKATPSPAESSGAALEPRGSNGIAIAPSNTANRRSLLLINPHTSFFFRSELQMTSEEGLNAYGAVTWGQFFVYQGFNETAGWMHTSSGVDNIDEYRETVVRKGGQLSYRYGNGERPVTVSTISVPYRSGAGLARREFTVYRTHHGPVVRSAGNEWITVRLMQEPMKALVQSYSRTRARNYRAFRETMELHTNSSNNTIFADAEGNIAYFHANFIPKRDPRLDWKPPVDGANPATEWGGVHSIDESPGLLNPPNGWLYNTNNWPYSAAGPHSPRQADYPPYMETGEENYRGLHAIRVLEGRRDFTPASLIEAAYDSYLPAFAEHVPRLIAAWDRALSSDPLKPKLREPISLLRTWDYRWSVESVPTAIAVFWGEELERQEPRSAGAVRMGAGDATHAADRQQLKALAAAVDTLTSHFGSWRTRWGEINRFQRLTGDIEHRFSDSGPSIPVGFTSARWGSLASYGAQARPGTRKWYGTSGNSFVAVVEFGDSVRARAVTAGGASGNPASPHFNDQARRYSTGDLRPVYFYRSQLAGHIEREYHPGN